jgi:hypothetical protein
MAVPSMHGQSRPAVLARLEHYGGCVVVSTWRVGLQTDRLVP